MKNSLLMNFTVDKQNKKIKVEREFAAPLDKVWAAWTDAKLLDKWWAPKPWKAITKSQTFKEGGSWIYAMVGPDGSEHWSKADYQSIAPKKSFSAKDGFCDKDGNINTAFPRSVWKNIFENKGDSTLVLVEITYDQLSDLEKIIEMGFKEGFTAGLENLDELLSKQ